MAIDLDRAKKKAQSSNCRYKVAAIGIGANGDVVCYCHNKPLRPVPGGSIHAEMAVMQRYGTVVKQILILRVNRAGELKPIHPCSTCARRAEQLGIKIITLKGQV